MAKRSNETLHSFTADTPKKARQSFPSSQSSVDSDEEVTLEQLSSDVKHTRKKIYKMEANLLTITSKLDRLVSITEKYVGGDNTAKSSGAFLLKTFIEHLNEYVKPRLIELAHTYCPFLLHIRYFTTHFF